MDPAIDNVGGGEGIAKCENTDQDLYWCIDGKHDESTCDTKDGVLFFPGKAGVCLRRTCRREANPDLVP